MRRSSCTRSTRTRRAPRSTSTAFWRSASAPPPPPPPEAERRAAVALIAAAGSGQRLGAGGPKALVEVAGRPLVAWSVEAFALAPQIAAIVVAAPAEGVSEVEAIARAASRDRCPVTVIPGGATRGESVALALAAAPPARVIAVHDAARPLVGPELVGSLVDLVEATPGIAGAIAATPVVDTVKRTARSHRAGPGSEPDAIVATEPREYLWAAQTPQVFDAGALRRAHAVEAEVRDAATDDAMLVEAQGGRVLVHPAPSNLKVTTAADLRQVEALLSRPTLRNTRQGA